MIPLQGVKLTFFPGSHLAPKYFKVVANSKKLVAIMTHTHKKNNFYPVTVLDRLNCSWIIVIHSQKHQKLPGLQLIEQTH